MYIYEYIYPCAHTHTHTHTHAHTGARAGGIPDLIDETNARSHERASLCCPETTRQSASASMRWPPIKTKCARWVPVVELRLRDVAPPFFQDWKENVVDQIMMTIYQLWLRGIFLCFLVIFLGR